MKLFYVNYIIAIDHNPSHEFGLQTFNPLFSNLQTMSSGMESKIMQTINKLYKNANHYLDYNRESVQFEGSLFFDDN